MERMLRSTRDEFVQAGSATIKGTISSGRHRVRVESGSLSITLGDDSNVTVKGDAQLGKVSWSGGHSGAGDEVVMGNGSARLDVEVVMGHASVKVGNDQPAEDLLALEGMDEETAFALASHGVRTSEDLSDLAADEVVEFGIEGLDEARAAALILAARAEEIARLERGA